MEGRSWRHPIIAFSFGESNLEQVRIGVADKGEAQQLEMYLERCHAVSF